MTNKHTYLQKRKLKTERHKLPSAKGKIQKIPWMRKTCEHTTATTILANQRITILMVKYFAYWQTKMKEFRNWQNTQTRTHTQTHPHEEHDNTIK